MYLKFNDSEELYQIKSISIKQNIIIIKNSIKQIPNNNSGFIIIVGNNNIRDYSDYTTKYNVITEIENGIIFSNNGSIETEENPIIVPETTKEQMQVILKNKKKEMISLSKQLLEEYLAIHPLTSTAHGGIEGIYSVTSEKQNLMTSNYLAYQIEAAVNPNAVLTWNETGKTCEAWTEQEFLQLVLEIRNYVKPKIEIQQIYEEAVNNATTIEEIDTIELNYEDGDEINEQ